MNFAWWLTSAVIAIALAGVVAWYFRQVARRLRPPGFFLVAVVIHALLVVGSFYVYLDPGAVPKLQRQFHQIVVRGRISLESVRRLFKPSAETFDQVADLKSNPTENPTVGGNILPTPGPAMPLITPISLEPLPRRSLAPRLAAPPDDAMAILDPGLVPRRRAGLEIAAEFIEIEIPPAAEEAAEKRLDGIPVELQRRAEVAAPDVASALPTGPVSVSAIPSAVASQVAAVEKLVPEATFPEQLPPRWAVPPAATSLPETDSRAEILPMPAVASSPAVAQAKPPSAAVHVEVARREAPNSLNSMSIPVGPRFAPSLPAGSPARGALAGNLGESPLARIDIDSDSLTGPLPRRAARMPSLSYDGEKIGLQAMFSHRQGETKREAIEAFGGSPQTVAAVRVGLAWIEKGQHRDGFWSLEQIYDQDRGQYYPGRGSQHSDSAATGLGLLPFLADGHTHVSGEHQAAVRKGIGWLVKHQKPDGDLSFQAEGNSQMYSHGIAAIALCEAYGMTRDPDLHGPAQRAIDFIVRAQTKGLGGWRYYPNQDSDMSIVGWEVMALKSGQMAGLTVPQGSLDLVHKWLDKVEGKGNDVGTFCYQPGRGITPEMTAEGLLCAQYLGADRNSPRLKAGANYLLRHLPKKGQQTSYYWYYGAQFMYHMQGDYWTKWNAALRDQLVQTQHRDGPMAGTWDPEDQWEQSGGRLYGTSLRLLMLTVYYRHLPLYQVLER